MSIAVLLTPRRVAVMLTVVLDKTFMVVTMKFACIAPGGMVTLDGTVATVVLLLVRDTVRPAAGAGLDMTTVPVEDVPPGTVAGVRETKATRGVRTVIAADLVTPPAFA